MTLRNATLMIPMLLLMASVLVACGQDVAAPDGGDPDMTEPAAQPATAPVPNASPSAMDPGLLDDAATGPLLDRAAAGGHLVDAAGLALYYLEANTDGGKCDDACQDVWPPVLTEAAPPAVAAGLDQSLVSTVATATGGVQHVTYDGHPLYRYAGDRGVGDTSGDGVDDAWGNWHLAKLPASGQTD